MAKPKKIGYVLMEIGWEYNDENYYRPESEGGTPKKVFMDLAKANRECAELNEASKNHIANYEYDEESGEEKEVSLNQFEVVEVEID
jgi:hypothetical protein